MYTWLMKTAAYRARRLMGGTPRTRALVSLLILVAVPLLGQYDISSLQYQNRGNRYEGIRSKLVSNSDVELLSALVDHREPGSSWPKTLHLRFFLPAAEQVFVTVRQPRPENTYYWLDRVVPHTPWRSGTFNEFAWPTDTVLRKIPGLTITDLCVVVRLNRQARLKEETIAPAALFSTHPPQAGSAYRFTFKTNESAKVNCWISRGDREVYRRPQTREIADIPFILIWRAQGQPAGEYRLHLSGTFDDNTPLAKDVIFYHRPSWQ
jgi:hypothetical protein